MKVVDTASVGDKTLLEASIGVDFVITKSTKELYRLGLVEGRKIEVLSRHYFLICKVGGHRVGISLDLAGRVEVK